MIHSGTSIINNFIEYLQKLLLLCITMPKNKLSKMMV